MKIVTFGLPCNLPPLITTGPLAEDIERYLRRVTTKPLTVHLDADNHGRALVGSRIAAAFTVAEFGTLGGGA